jgi:YegS/Rv2252/BmrU family lipid kinase
MITFGGDGTISEVARGILRSGAAAELAVLPQGTGADFLRTLGVPSRLADAARALRDGRTRTIDVGEVSFTAHDGTTESRFFINSASFGLSGEVASRTNRGNMGGGRPLVGGALAYATETLKAALAFEPPNVWLQIGTDAARRLPITQVSINNGRFFGGGMKIAPHASLVDGLLDLVVVRKLSFARIAGDGARIYTGTHLSLPEVTHAQVATVRAWPASEGSSIGLEVDGETPGVLPATFSVRPGALAIRVGRRA